MKTILITGINGFLGSYLAKRLSGNYKIIGLEYSKDNLFRLRGLDFKIYVSNSGELDILFKENIIDIIIHTATFYGKNSEDISQVVEANLFAPFQLLDYAIRNKVALFVNSDTVLDRFLNMYALSKRQFQEWLFMRRSDIKVINMQLEHFYGHGCSKTNFISSMIERLEGNERSIDLTEGNQKRDFIYYEDIIDAYELVVNNYLGLSEDYRNFGVGTGEYHSIKEVLIKMKELIGSNSLLNFGAIPYRKNELMASKTDITGLMKLGWKPKYDIISGLKNTIKKK